MNKEELEKLYEKWQQKADAAYSKLQEITSTKRDLTAYDNAAEIVDGLKLAMDAVDTAQAYGALKADMMDFCSKAMDIRKEPNPLIKTYELVEELRAYGKAMGFVWDKGDIKNG